MAIGIYVSRIVIIFSILCSEIAYGQGPVVNTTLGQVRGVVADDGDYTMFLGIPFGKLQEDNPFGDAFPHPDYDGIFEADDDSAICPQREEFNQTLVGDLDCLHLNIHVPNTANPANLRPVYVWIYGGGFNIGFFGRFLYGPKYLVRHDIVLVTFNYRVNVYGFMCLDIPEVSGNQGLKDQLLALKWIRDNIANFGGDPDNVTIGGNSAGGMAAEFHIIHQNNKPKLFHKAILQSGTAYAVNPREPVNDTPLRLAQHLGLQTNDVYEAIGYLAKVDPLVIVESAQEIGYSNSICIEKEFENVEAFLTENVNLMAEIPGAKDIDIMLGFNNDELYASALGGLTANNAIIVRNIMSMQFDSQHPDIDFMVDNMYHFYFGDDEMNDDQKQNYGDFMGDLNFIYPTLRSMKRFLSSDVGKMYLYKFSYNGGRNFVKHRENFTEGGAYHADEYGYLFDISYMDEPTAEDLSVIDAMTALWANFVKYSDPTFQTSTLLPYKWEAITKNSPQHYIEIDKDLRVGTRPFQERMVYWDLIYDENGKH